jgi:hypothetical protein
MVGALLKSYLWLILLAVLIQGLALLLINVASIDALPYFYNGALYILVATALLTAIQFWRKRATEANLILLSFACVINLAYFALIPTIIDRSISVFVMNELVSGPKNLTQLEEAFVADFVYQGKAVPKRISEQELSGNIQRNTDGSYALTKSGRRTVVLFRLLGKIYKTDRVSIE